MILLNLLRDANSNEPARGPSFIHVHNITDFHLLDAWSDAIAAHIAWTRGRRAMDTAERKPTKVGCRLSQISTSLKTCHFDAPITLAAITRCLRALTCMRRSWWC